MNYNDWFHQYHKYLEGQRNGVTSYNDTKWNTINQRYKKLIDISSALLDEQPYNVVGNYVGFQQLNELIQNSGYTYEDVDQSFVDMYRMNLQNAMSRMLVNTHAVIVHYNQRDKNHVYKDPYGHYYIIDVPFDQLHFGERDEFIRQKLHEFYETENQYYMPSDKFLSNEISSILGFTLICCVNGMMSNDWFVGIDEKGFRIKIGWSYTSDADFIVYKLDATSVFEFADVAYKNIESQMELGYDLLKSDLSYLNGRTCIIQIYDSRYPKDVTVVPNFGYFTEYGLQISNLQDKTLRDLTNLNTENVNIRVYVVQYLHELEGIYPSIDYMEMIDSSLVYNERYQHITDDEGRYIHAKELVSNQDTNRICTPPISPEYDYNTSKNHAVIRDCYQVSLYTLTSTMSDMIKLGNQLVLLNKNSTVDEIDNRIVNPSKTLYQKFRQAYAVYVQGAIITELIPANCVDQFEMIVNQLKLLSEVSVSDYKSIQRALQTSVLYPDEYKPIVEQIMKPLQQSPFTLIGQIQYPDYFPMEYNRTHQLLRPISEQCFITLKYNSDDDMQCWVFYVPTIKHFKGIENVFYIDDGLTGDEVFKFFYLYTDTEDPCFEKNTTMPMTFDQLIDFDLFSKEINKSIGYIRYWNVSNRIAKLSQMLYQKYDEDTIVSIFSKILKRKINDKTFLEYPSEINYEISNITSDNVNEYTEYSDRAPFALNFMFYTLKSMFDQPDRLQSYFLDVLTRKEFYPRYSDLTLNEIYEKTYPIIYFTDTLNYSAISYSPYRTHPLDGQSSPQLPTGDDVRLFTGINFPVKISVDQQEAYLFDSIGSMIDDGVRYPWSFNVYQPMPHAMITNDSIESTYFMMHRSIDYGIPNQYRELRYNTFYDDIQIVKIICTYLAEIYPNMSEIFTDYKNIWDKTVVVNSLMRTWERATDRIQSYITSRGDNIQYRNPNTEAIVTEYFDREQIIGGFYEQLEELNAQYMSLKMERKEQQKPNSSITNIFSITSRLLMMIESIYENTGFVQYAIRRIRKTYIHLKKINQPMSFYQYKEWINNIDIDLLEQLSSYYSEDGDIVYSKSLLDSTVREFKSKIEAIISNISAFEEWMYEFKLSYEGDDQYQKGYVNTLKEYCDEVIQTNIFDFYKLNSISIPETITTTKPAFAEIHIDAADPHVDFGLTDDFKTNGNIFELLLSLRYEKQSQQRFVIHEVIPTCVYAFKSGEPMDVTVHIYDDALNEIASVEHIQLTFMKVGTSADISNDIYPFSNAYTIPLEVQNVHESFDVNGYNQVFNTRHAELHYELLCGNHFAPLTHNSEYCVQDQTELQGPIDKLYLSCEKMNQLAFNDISNRPTKRMFFQPTQVMHIEPSDDVITSIGGKYFEGQRIYAITDDGLSLIPLIITSIDHSQERGFIEARVDLYHAKWFETADPNVMEQYLLNDITCNIVDDNIRNFMDEFTEYDGYIPDITLNSTIDHEIIPQFTLLPGDPYFVENNPDYVYQQLIDIYPDAQYKSDDAFYHRFIYLGSSPVYIETNDNMIQLDMINHNFNPHTLQELYPVLRDEPDDLRILKEEREIFNGDAEGALRTYVSLLTSSEYARLKKAVEDAKTELEHAIAVNNLNEFEANMHEYVYRAQWLMAHRRDLETPTTWYNVNAYDDALVYISNGRAKTFRSFSPHIQDISYNDNLEILLYDWEHRVWIDPNLYTIEMNVENGLQIDPVNDYQTNNVLTSINIELNSVHSKRILIYLVYGNKDQFDIPLNDMKCDIRFRPVLSLKSSSNDNQQNETGYNYIRIRKHYDSNESYEIRSTYPLPEEFGSMDGVLIKRPSNNGTYTDGSPIRFEDMHITMNNQTYSYSEFDVYIQNPMTNTTMDQVAELDTFAASILRMPSEFEQNKEISLIPISNQDDILFNGAVSNIVFTGVTSDNVITITKCSKEFTSNTSILCTILPNEHHHISGGMVRVTVTHDTVRESSIKNWIHLSDDQLIHRLIPNVFVLIPKTLSITNDICIKLSNHYVNDFDTDVNIDNSNVNDPYVYYYDKSNHVRYPIADIRQNTINKRLLIDRTLNTNISMIRSNYIGITRYVSQRIPKDGVIDLTGKIPTPLSRDRYEFWVNGRYVNDERHLIILSPTCIQLRNLISLKNLEVIELVDDMHDTILTPTGPVYIDINGKTYTSYIEMMLHHANITNETIEYYFDQNTQSGFDTYLPEPIRYPNNKDYEVDILSYIISNDETISYDTLYNIPSINGVSIYNITSESIGFVEIPNQQVLDMFDKVWKREALNGIVPFNHSMQYIDSNIKEQTLHVRVCPTGGFDIYTSGLNDRIFTLYISDMESGKIDDPIHTKQIIPMVRPGVVIHIDDTYQDMWLHSTNITAEPIQIK